MIGVFFKDIHSYCTFFLNNFLLTFCLEPARTFLCITQYRWNMQFINFIYDDNEKMFKQLVQKYCWWNGKYCPTHNVYENTASTRAGNTLRSFKQVTDRIVSEAFLLFRTACSKFTQTNSYHQQPRSTKSNTHVFLWAIQFPIQIQPAKVSNTC